MTNAEAIILSVCRQHRIHPHDVMRKRDGIPREKAVNARTVIVGRLRDELHLPLMEIGRLLGGRHHTTILHYLRKAA